MTEPEMLLKRPLWSIIAAMGSKSEIRHLVVGSGILNLGLVVYAINQAAKQNPALGQVAILQTSPRPQGIAVVDALNAQQGNYPVRIEGLLDGRKIQRTETVTVVSNAYAAARDWPEVLKLCRQIDCLTCNTADKGYELFAEDSPASQLPRSWPAKLLLLLHERYKHDLPGLALFPCELISNNAQILKGIILELAEQWKNTLGTGFSAWLEHECFWVKTLVDRIVSAPIDPVGAVCEPFALWALENQPGLEIPWRSAEAVRIVDDLQSIAALKLGVLNFSHTFWIEKWMRAGKPSDLKLVRDISQNPEYLNPLKTILNQEVLPVLKIMAPQEDVYLYAEKILERFQNPFLEHQLASIAQNHDQKVQRRIAQVQTWARQYAPHLSTPLIDALLEQRINSPI
jgi:tagaturonate reductase